ncbi:hypothetical protein B0H11DRAFT_313906 [Mycena galericulata]|nr:hypothetical protein B0H11DRAFT_313906 [Mycena galericulata]
MELQGRATPPDFAVETLGTQGFCYWKLSVGFIIGREPLSKWNLLGHLVEGMHSHLIMSRRGTQYCGTALRTESPSGVPARADGPLYIYYRLGGWSIRYSSSVPRPCSDWTPNSHRERCLAPSPRRRWRGPAAVFSTRRCLLPCLETKKRACRNVVEGRFRFDMPWEVHQVVNVVSSLHGYILFPPPFSFVAPAAMFYAMVSTARFGACPVRTSVPPAPRCPSRPHFGALPIRTSVAPVPRCPSRPHFGASPIRTSVPVPSALRCPSRPHFGARPALRRPSARRRSSRPHFGAPRASVLVPSALRAPPRFGARAVRTSVPVLHFGARPRFGARPVLRCPSGRAPKCGRHGHRSAGGTEVRTGNLPAPTS